MEQFFGLSTILILQFSWSLKELRACFGVRVGTEPPLQLRRGILKVPPGLVDLSVWKRQSLHNLGEGQKTLKEKLNPSWTPFYRLRPWGPAVSLGFPTETKNPRVWISLQGVGGEDPAGWPLSGLVGVKGHQMLLQKRPLPPFPVREAALHHLPRGKVVATVCTFSFKLTSGLDLVRMEQGNPKGGWLWWGFVHIKQRAHPSG